jgi:hypothetical protein
VLRIVRLQLEQKELLVPVERIVLCFPADSIRFAFDAQNECSFDNTLCVMT